MQFTTTDDAAFDGGRSALNLLPLKKGNEEIMLITPTILISACPPLAGFRHFKDFFRILLVFFTIIIHANIL